MSDVPIEKRILRDLGYFGHYLHVHRGGRGGKQHVLAKLLKHGQPMTQRELQDDSKITSASLSEVLAKLEAEGLVTRERSEEDRRQLTISLTPLGHQRACEVVVSRRAFEAQAMSVLTNEEQVQLLGLLDRLVEHWESIEGNEKGEGACGK